MSAGMFKPGEGPLRANLEVLAENLKNERRIKAELLEELDDATALLNAMLGAMPPALQKKWPSITARAKARVQSAHAAVIRARGGQ